MKLLESHFNANLSGSHLFSINESLVDMVNRIMSGKPMACEKECFIAKMDKMEAFFLYTAVPLVIELSVILCQESGDKEPVYLNRFL